MPTLKELKDMLQKVEAEGEAAIERLFEGEAPSIDPQVEEETAAAVAAPEVADPVFVSEKPYGFVDGIPGVKYQQGGEYFDNRRKFVRKA